ncbi:GGDEF domain-containing protein [Rhizobiaceae bacterium n13]|uniref:diguanylate cyclase n=1 Tax=Ferirhizobium litorale TaxID=2927786 RepID=A0AAE3Q9N3_9HYPH|nr:GGDEF domain-containing protein [Fererhizobium litorale]MDI7861891.1 GGDEF domain-containing protein [Fererhizobium litorale]MDI7921767.1 GGDEF domain-containing protein [Fererhizobium litorale]
MMFDHNSLLLALGFSGICLAATLLGSWFMARTESFLITWAVGVLFIAASTFTYESYRISLSLPVWIVFYLLLMAGLSTLVGAAYQFRTGSWPWRKIACAAAAPIVLGPPIAYLGYSGAATILLNAFSALLLFVAAGEHWKGRDEAPTPIAGLVILYSLIAMSFVLCAGVLLADGKWVIDGAPSNWAEDINLIFSIAGMTGIGALSLALNHARTAQSSRRDALTDNLTGLMNRRALFERHGTMNFNPAMAVVVFDLDRFKMINDIHGHAVGDRVLAAFAEELLSNSREGDSCVRLGGEEFALVLGHTLPEWTEQTAERIRGGFANRRIIAGGHLISCTASAGISYGTADGLNLDAMLNAADKALYSAKRAGRNRIAVSQFREAV